jgi:alkaline phosphatase
MCAGGAAAEGAGLQRISAAAYQYWAKLKPPAEGSVVVMLADGYGPQIHTIARGLLREQSGNASALLDLDAHLVGSAITASASNAITDSAAGATAYAAATKSYNGAVGVLHRKGEDPTACEHSAGRCAVRPVASLFEACRARGMATGLVVTTVLPHATPASFSAHAAYRYSYELIAQQQLEADPPIDVLLGGGRRFFDARRRDGRDLLAEHAARYHLVESRATLLAARGAAAPPARALLGLFADGDMHYEIDRERRAAGGAGGGGSGGGSVGGERKQPSLEEMTEVALERLEAVAGARGFCLLVEGSCPAPDAAPRKAPAPELSGARGAQVAH